MENENKKYSYEYAKKMNEAKELKKKASKAKEMGRNKLSQVLLLQSQNVVQDAISIIAKLNDKLHDENYDEKAKIHPEIWEDTKKMLEQADLMKKEAEDLARREDANLDKIDKTI